MSNQDKILIILAGGESTRFGKIGDIVPKFLLPVNNTNLLQRQIHYATEARMRKIIISTLPKFVSIIQDSLSERFPNIKIFSNSFHDMSSFSGLAQVIKEVRPKEAVAISFSDIYFIDNPFIDDIPSQTSVYLSQPFFELELELGGVVFLKNNFVKKMVAEPLINNRQGLRWNGLCVLSSQDQKFLVKYTEGKTADFPEEDFFNFLLVEGKEIAYKDSVDFINNNTPEDLFLSGLYGFAENFNSSDRGKILDAVKIIRKSIYTK